MEVVGAMPLVVHSLVSNMYLMKMKDCLFHKVRPQLCTFPGLEFTLISKNSALPKMSPKVGIQY